MQFSLFSLGFFALVLFAMSTSPPSKIPEKRSNPVARNVLLDFIWTKFCLAASELHCQNRWMSAKSWTYYIHTYYAVGDDMKFTEVDFSAAIRKQKKVKGDFDAKQNKGGMYHDKYAPVKADVHYWLVRPKGGARRDPQKGHWYDHIKPAPELPKRSDRIATASTCTRATTESDPPRKSAKAIAAEAKSKRRATKEGAATAKEPEPKRQRGNIQVDIKSILSKVSSAVDASCSLLFSPEDPNAKTIHSSVTIPSMSGGKGTNQVVIIQQQIVTVNPPPPPVEPQPTNDALFDWTCPKTLAA